MASQKWEECAQADLFAASLHLSAITPSLPSNPILSRRAVHLVAEATLMSADGQEERPQFRLRSRCEWCFHTDVCWRRLIAAEGHSMRSRRIDPDQVPMRTLIGSTTRSVKVFRIDGERANFFTFPDLVRDRSVAVLTPPGGSPTRHLQVAMQVGGRSRVSLPLSESIVCGVLSCPHLLSPRQIGTSIGVTSTLCAVLTPPFTVSWVLLGDTAQPDCGCWAELIPESRGTG